jgi:hypothetical protein
MTHNSVISGQHLQLSRILNFIWILFLLEFVEYSEFHAQTLAQGIRTLGFPLHSHFQTGITGTCPLFGAQCHPEDAHVSSLPQAALEGIKANQPGRFDALVHHSSLIRLSLGLTTNIKDSKLHPQEEKKRSYSQRVRCNVYGSA